MKLLISLAVILFLTTVIFAQAENKDEQTFRPIIRQMTTAQLAYDTATLDKLLTADYIEISPLGEFDPRDKVLSFYTPKAKAEAGNMSGAVEIGDLNVRSYDKVAVAIARFTFTMQMDGKPLPPRSMRVSLVFRKEKSGWKIASTQYTGIRTKN